MALVLAARIASRRRQCCESAVSLDVSTVMVAACAAGARLSSQPKASSRASHTGRMFWRRGWECGLLIPPPGLWTFDGARNAGEYICRPAQGQAEPPVTCAHPGAGRTLGFALCTLNVETGRRPVSRSANHTLANV